MTEAVVLAFVASVFAVPGVTSIVTSVVRKLSDALGIDPRVIVYVASIALTGVIMFSGGVTLPAWTGDPTLFVAAWLAWAVANAEIARRLFEALLKFVPGLAAPASA